MSKHAQQQHLDSLISIIGHTWTGLLYVKLAAVREGLPDT